MYKTVADNPYIHDYISQSMEVMQQLHPEWDADILEKKIIKIVNKRCQNPPVVIDNNYTGESAETSLVAVFGWAKERKPIIAGNGTFYQNQHENLSPCSQMLIDILGNRAKIKAEMFSIEDVNSYAYEFKDRGQGTEKRRANSYYGAGGTKGSRFYSEYSAPATTLTAQSVISTTEQLFESFLGDNYIFLDVTELVAWLRVVDKEQEELESSDSYEIFDDLWQPSKGELFDRLYSKIMVHEDSDDKFLYRLIKTFDDAKVKYVYYKNNLRGFIEKNPVISNEIIGIMKAVPYYNLVDEDDPDWRDKVVVEGDFKKAKDYNKYLYKEMFFDPNKVPKSIECRLRRLSNLVMSYVYTGYISFDKIYRLRNLKRKVVTIIDTDSNILILDAYIKFFMEIILVKDNEATDRPMMFNKILIVNTLTYLITDAVNSILLLYGKQSNIPEEYRSRFNMKNEFFMPKLFIGDTKKRYISLILLREGRWYDKEDVKGFDFKKATTSKYVTDVCNYAIKHYLLEPDGFDVDGLMRYVHKFKQKVSDSIVSGETTYLPIGNAKEVIAYKYPEREEPIRGVYAWNAIYPDQAIELPTKVSLVKMKIFKVDDMKELEHTNPDIYERIVENIFEDKTGIFNTTKFVMNRVEKVPTTDKRWLDKIPSKYRKEWKNKTPGQWNKFVDSYTGADKYLPDSKRGEWVTKKRGLQVLAIPTDGRIPDWVRPYMDLTYTVSKIMSPVNALTSIFHSQTISEGKSYNGINRKAETFSNIIKI